MRGPFSRFAADEPRRARLVDLARLDGRWHGIFVEWDRHAQPAVIGARPLDALGTVTARWETSIAHTLVVTARLTEGGPWVAHRGGEERGDTAIRVARLVTPSGSEWSSGSDPAVPAFGEPDREEGEVLRAFDFRPGDPLLAVSAWLGRSRRPRPRGELAAAQRRFEQERRDHPNQMHNPPDPYRTVGVWRRLGVGGARGLRAHEVHGHRNHEGDEAAPRVEGVVAGDRHHVALLSRPRGDDHRGLVVWFLDARSGRRVAQHVEPDDAPHGFSFRGGLVDDLDRFWLVGAATSTNSEAHWVWVFDERHRLLSRRRLPHRASWVGPARFVSCGDAIWLVATAVDQTSPRERILVYRLDPAADVEAGRVLFDESSPYGPGDAVWHTHELQVACAEGEAVAAFHYTPRERPAADTPIGVIRWDASAAEPGRGPT